MYPVLVASSIVGVLAVGGFSASIIVRSRREKAVLPVTNLSTFAGRHQQMVAEVEARKSSEQIYRERIDAAFIEAHEAGVLIVDSVRYADIENDMYRNRSRYSDRSDSPYVKPLLTRITPVMTTELAERIREYEIMEHSDYDSDSEGLAGICIAARTIKWRVEEVPLQYEPPNLKDVDRISYPDLTMRYVLPEDLKKAAREVLDYGDEYVVDQAELRNQKSDSFEVTEE